MEERVRRLLEAVDLVLIRHGKTSKAIDDSPEADKARKVNAVGETQCTQAREGWFRAVHPVGMILHSEAGRTVETATRLLEGAAACPTSVLHTLYGGVNSQTNEMNFAEMEAVFDEYLPLRAYLPQVPAESVSRYADCALQEILPLVEPPPADAKSVVVVSHAVYVSILAAAIATAAGFSEAEQAVLFESNVGEVSGFRISLRPRQITYVGETL